ncbi:TIGR03749 family integrating conjugative element protein [Pseudomonas stutzeri]|jgi:integrating conjugative element protein (TIGR03749 family)|uniref:TIGR03749 family integrating conjugative element protein n=1 Tax=Pseudomonadaceae TaxID=135621 RepID=UPI00088D3EE0|nr:MULTISPECIES: TIGR03749 family integrating conjugative element protein [Pseudomonadaceae]MBA4689240.1 TIGR03749 family integrating conjugative element protein [Pseudomonas sp.]SCY85967.1 integrating conjugative element protein, family [Acinetobacter baumannii]MCF0017154.1 TIGR03749 family integrating conjugative element protein [Stutzerimonas stutzeri]MCF0022254.1 TIGR03749 family integrating conjugative element protein [Stutzerimonas stutzeri]MDH0103230.1 TIGR03749 family integrating conju
MKRLVLNFLATATLTLGLIPSALALEILRWERLPLAVPLVVGHERVIFIDRNVRVGVPASLGDRLRVQSAGGALYLLASEPIEPTRLQLQDANTGILILLDIAAEPGEAPLEPVRIVEGESHAKRYGDASQQPAADAARPPARETPVPVVLTRYAAQSLYAPLRTVEPVNGVVRVNLRRDLALDTLLPTLPVRARALAAWRLEDQWVTAIRLTNTSGRWIDLDPRALQGDFVTATFQHPDLGPAGDSRDTSVVYLVTRGRGLAQSLLPAISPIDAAHNLPASAAVGSAEGAGDAQ